MFRRAPISRRETHFGPDFITNPDAFAFADPDGDGANNFEEFTASTDPKDRLSGFKASVAAVPKITFPFGGWQSVSDTEVEHVDGTPAEIATITATGPHVSFVDESPGEAAFYLVELLP